MATDKRKSPLEGLAAYWAKKTPEEREAESVRMRKELKKHKEEKEAAEKEAERKKWGTTSTCSGCQGTVVIEKIHVDISNGVIGGYPRKPVFRAAYHCRDCGLVYKFLPPRKSGVQGPT
jgi:hypothetical protein